MNTLYLTATEKKLFDALSENLKEGWQIADADISYDETPEKRLIRFRLVRLQDPALKTFQEKAIAAKTEEEISDLLASFDMASLNEVDMTEIMYAMGPDLIGGVIEHYLKHVENDEDIEGIASISVFRNLFFSSQAANVS